MTGKVLQRVQVFEARAEDAASLSSSALSSGRFPRSLCLSLLLSAIDPVQHSKAFSCLQHRRLFCFRLGLSAEDDNNVHY